MAKNSRDRFKRAVNTADQLASGGLSEDQRQMFAEYTRDQTQMDGIGADTTIFQGGTYTIPDMNPAKFVAIPKKYAGNERLRRRIKFSEVKLNPTEFVCPVLFTEKMIRDAVGDKEVTKEAIVQMFAKVFANNLEKAMWESNALGPATNESTIIDGAGSAYILHVLYSQFDGLLKQAEGAVSVDVQNNDLDADWVNKAKVQLPEQYDMNAMRLLVPRAHKYRYDAQIAARGTALGDAVLEGRQTMPFGVEMIPMDLMPRNPLVVEHTVNSGTTPNSLKYNNISSLNLNKTTLDEDGGAAGYVITTDYTQDLVAGTWTRNGGGSIGSSETVKTTYNSLGRALLIRPSNIAIGLVRDSFEILSGQEIFQNVWQYAIHGAFDIKIKNLEEVIVLKNIKNPA